jgi:transposase-like protein
MQPVISLLQYYNMGRVNAAITTHVMSSIGNVVERCSKKVHIFQNGWSIMDGFS